MKEPSLVSIAGEDRQFVCGADEYLLDAAQRGGLRLAHNCRGGACGTCKADILEGAVDHGWVMSFAISDQEKAEGKCLLRVSRPASPRITVRLHGGVGDTAAALSSSPAEHEATPLQPSRHPPIVGRLVTRIFLTLVAMGFAAPATAHAQDSSQAYCKQLSEMYRRYVQNAPGRGRSDVEAILALEECSKGNGAMSIPILEKRLRDNGITPPGGEFEP